MVLRLRFIAIPAVLAMVLIILPQRTARADQPSIQRISFDSGQYVAPNLTRACGFTVMREDIVNVTIFTYPDGTEKDVWTGPSYTTWTGPGGSYTADVHGHITITPNPDGTTTVIEVGDNYLLTLPGDGVVRGSAGRQVDVFDQSGNLISATFTGKANYSSFAAQCAYLAGA